MRVALWPEISAAALVAEAEAFAEGDAVTTVSVVFLAEEQERVVGFIELLIRPFADGCDSAPIPHVEGWYVEPAARTRGVGRALMGRAEAWARDQGFTELASDTEIHNAGSLAAHERCGFVETERLIKLRKPLEAPAGRS
jgi:aminoglycoside 6'-N-acetyltransferase I